MKSFLKGALIFLIVTLVIGLAGFLSLGLWLSPQSNLAKAEAIVAVSGGETQTRTLEAVKLYKADWAPLLIFSGAALDPGSISNAKAMQRLAISEGVPAEAIVLDEGSANTVQNALGVAKIVNDHKLRTVILVTSPYHQRRASLNFHQALGKDVTIINHSATDKKWRRSRWWESRESFELTMAELQKTLFVLFAGNKVPS